MPFIPHPPYSRVNTTKNICLRPGTVRQQRTSNEARNIRKGLGEAKDKLKLEIKVTVLFCIGHCRTLSTCTFSSTTAVITCPQLSSQLESGPYCARQHKHSETGLSIEGWDQRDLKSEVQWALGVFSSSEASRLSWHLAEGDGPCLRSPIGSVVERGIDLKSESPALDGAASAAIWELNCVEGIPELRQPLF